MDDLSYKDDKEHKALDFIMEANGGLTDSADWRRVLPLLSGTTRGRALCRSDVRRLPGSQLRPTRHRQAAVRERATSEQGGL